MISHNFKNLFSLDNLLKSWFVFKKGKTGSTDVNAFERHLEDNIFLLHEDIMSGNYKHGQYEYFQVFDSKKRDIYKASVRDRVVHRTIYDCLVEIYDNDFIFDSFASRKNKGTHKAISRARTYIGGVRFENGGRCFVLKCDVKKFFRSINHRKLRNTLGKKVVDREILGVINEIISSFSESADAGMPLGNVTSQIFANIYLHPLDMFVKYTMGVERYIRYSDDLAIIHHDKEELLFWKNEIQKFVFQNLLLEIPEEKTSIRKVEWGVEFLGSVIFPSAVVIREKTKRKMLANLNRENASSYFGLVSQANSHYLKQKMSAILIKKSYES